MHEAGVAVLLKSLVLNQLTSSAANSSLNLQSTMAYFGGPLEYRDKNLKPVRAQVYSSNEWNNLITRLDDRNQELDAAKEFSNEKQQLKERSRQMRQEWTDTQQSIRERRLQAVDKLRQERFAGMDKMVAEQKDKAFQEAKKIIDTRKKKEFFERDRVKAFNVGVGGDDYRF